MRKIPEINDIIEAAKSRLTHTATNMSKRMVLSEEQFKDFLTTLCQTVIYERKQESEFIIDNNNREVIAVLFEYLTQNWTHINPNIGIVMSGKFGCGKSILMSGFCRLLAQIDVTLRDVGIKEYHAVELTELILRDGMEKYVKRPILIQDIGKEPKIVKDFGNDKNPLRELLMARCEFGSLTFGTTNYSKETFESAYPDFPIRPDVKVTTTSKRLFEHINFIILKGDNRRKSYIYG